MLYYQPNSVVLNTVKLNRPSLTVIKSPLSSLSGTFHYRIETLTGLICKANKVKVIELIKQSMVFTIWLRFYHVKHEATTALTTVKESKLIMSLASVYELRSSIRLDKTNQKPYPCLNNGGFKLVQFGDLCKPH